MIRFSPLRHVSKWKLGAILLLVGAAASGSASEGIPVISRGDAVELTNHLVPGKWVLFDFYADWCGPCRQVEPVVEDLARRNGDRLAVRKIDIVNWGSSVANQYGVNSIPHMKLYGPDGARLAEGRSGEVLRELDRLLASGAPPGGAVPGAPSPRSASAESEGPGLLPLVSILALALGIATFFLVQPLRRAFAPSALRAPSPRSPSTHPTLASGPSSAEPRHWFVKLDVGIDGPYSDRELETMKRFGHLNGDTPVQRKGEAGWRKLSDAIG